MRQTPEQNKRIRRRIDMFLLPLFLITQTLQYLDKTALNYAKVFGMVSVLPASAFDRGTRKGHLSG